MTYDLVVRGGTVVTPTQIATGDVGIDGGVIREIADELPGGHDEIDARGLLVLPGAVDAHVHLNDPGRSDWEGIATGTAALAVGGSTTAIDMPLNAHPPTVDAAAFDLKAARIAESAHVDIALWGGLVPGNVGQMEELAERGVVGFKAFMCASGIDDFAAADDATLLAGHARGGPPGTARRRARRERHADQGARRAGRRRGTHHDARLPRIAPRRGGAGGDRARARARARGRLLAAHRARVERQRRRAGVRGPRGEAST